MTGKIEQMIVDIQTSMHDRATKMNPQLNQASLPVYMAGVFDQQTVIRIGRQIDEIYRDVGGGVPPQLIHGAVQYCVSVKVQCHRGVELIAKALASARMGMREKYVQIVEGILWELTLHKHRPVKDDKDYIQRMAVMVGCDIYGVTPNVPPTYDQVLATLDKYIAGESAPMVNEKPIEKVRLLELEENFYRSVRRDDEIVISREYGIHPTSEMPMQGAWVMRNYHTGEFIDSDKYINDLTERNNLTVL